MDHPSASFDDSSFDPTSLESELSDLIEHDNLALLEDQLAAELLDKMTDSLTEHGVYPLSLRVEDEEREPTTEENVQILVEEAILEAVLRMTIAFEREALLGKPHSIDDLTDIKKTYMAQLLVQGYVTVNDKWYGFLNAYLPGEAFDSTVLSDNEYIARAFQKHEDEQELMKVYLHYTRKYSLLLQEHQLMKNDEPFISDDLFYTLARYLAEAPKNTHEAEASVDELCREHGLETRFAEGMKLLIRQYAFEAAQLKNE